MTRVTVIGGGFAGLSAAVALAQRGVLVDVLEARTHLGGRAYSFRDRETGAVVDNGQHALMGCYRRTLAFLDRIGASGRLFRQHDLTVPLVHPTRGAGALACPGLPAPLHVMGGILRCRLLEPRERLRALRAGVTAMAMRRGERLRAMTVEELLVRLRQSPHARATFWHPVAIATLNERPERASAAPFVEVLARAFFGSRRDSQFVLPRVGLSELYVDDARRFVEARGGTVVTGEAVAALETDGGRVCALRMRSGTRRPVDACVSALPPRALAPLVALPVALDRFETSPIVSAHLWLDRSVLRAPFVGLIGTTTQWLFDRRALTGEPVVSAVISAGREPATWSSAEVADAVMADMRALLPAARGAVLRRAVVVKEKEATIAPTPEAEALRPAPATPYDNFVLAGDWTATGLPPTIESAVVSGERAAEMIAARLAA